ncbi:basic salivary proline-rich protein 1-like [Vidua chalybeata]|uniref:basic salivary proline-rich protein 1-like n=1 Tax=Vidua chalybeata TaxID=81927 RepID=UPI0023A7D3CC|nr:basic salivary proline-rich protein 1-like [Vidua chalybeata]
MQVSLRAFPWHRARLDRVKVRPLPAVTQGRAEPVKPLGGSAGTRSAPGPVLGGPAPHKHEPARGPDTGPDTQPNTNRTGPGRAGHSQPPQSAAGSRLYPGPARGAAPVPEGSRDRQRDRPALRRPQEPPRAGEAQRPPRAAQGPRAASGPASPTMIEPPPPPRLGPGAAPEALGARGGAAPETPPEPSDPSDPAQVFPKLPRPLPGTRWVPDPALGTSA